MSEKASVTQDPKDAEEPRDEERGPEDQAPEIARLARATNAMTRNLRSIVGQTRPVRHQRNQDPRMRSNNNRKTMNNRQRQNQFGKPLMMGGTAPTY